MPVADSPELPYVQVASDLRRRIEAGEWQPGQRMPAVTELATHYGCASGTIRKALRVLADEDHSLVIVPRWGTFLA